MSATGRKNVRVPGDASLKHGHCRRGRRSDEYKVWAGLVRRCHNPNEKLFAYYGARGVTVCDEWRGPGGFIRFLEHMGLRPSSGHSVDRIDNSKGYEPGNVRWATKIEQMNNMSTNRRITIDGETKTLAQWVAVYGAVYKTVHKRITYKGWDIKKALLESKRRAP
jgi:hypothetical protein